MAASSEFPDAVCLWWIHSFNWNILIVFCGISCLFLTLACVTSVPYHMVSYSECIAIGIGDIRCAGVSFQPYLSWLNMRKPQTPRKLLGFHRIEDRFWPDFTDIKHDYTQKFYRSYSSFISHCLRTGKFCGICNPGEDASYCIIWRQSIKQLYTSCHALV